MCIIIMCNIELINKKYVYTNVVNCKHGQLSTSVTNILTSGFTK